MVFSYCNIFSAFIQSNDSGTNWREECNKKFFSYITGWRAKFFTSKITKKVKVLSSSPLFFLNCWVNISDNRGIVASEDNKKFQEENLQPHNNVWKCVEKLSMKKIHSNAFIPEKFEIS